VRAPGDRIRPIFPTPIASVWKERASKTGTYKGDWVTKRAPYFPDDFDWSFFAPRLQSCGSTIRAATRPISSLASNAEQPPARCPVCVRAFAQPKAGETAL
jgi:hypothetical protein